MSNGRLFLDEINEHMLLGDGSLGTELLSRGIEYGNIEQANLAFPQAVQRLHAEYAAAGCRVLETNTFAANTPRLARRGHEKMLRDILRAGARLAREAAGQTAYVAGSIGPLPEVEGEALSPDDQRAAFAEVIDCLANEEVDLLIFETFPDADQLVRAVAEARSRTDLPIVAQGAFELNGFTTDGCAAEDLARRCREAGADIVGANCGEGIPAVLQAIRRMAAMGGLMSAFPNMGFPHEIAGRHCHMASPGYFAGRCLELIGLGARLVGGCCGTNPAILRALANELALHPPVHVSIQHVPAAPAPAPPVAPAEIAPPPRGVIVELDPPRDMRMEPMIEAARRLREAGVSGISVADNPLASVRPDAVVVASRILHEAGLPAIPHLTGRDRNRIALQSSLMGAHVAGIRSVLCVTGDPVRMYHEKNTTGVFDLTSVGLVQLVAEFNAGKRAGGGECTSFAIGVALNPNVRSMQGQIDKLRRKIDAGAHFALTQPIFDEKRMDVMQEHLDRSGIRFPIFVGILPLMSLRNAEFLHYEVPGMSIPEELRARLGRYEKTDDQRAAGIEIAAELATRFAPRAYGLFVMAPRNRAEIVLPVVEAARSHLLASAGV